MKRQGFTLVELMVVIIIIALLMALISTAVVSARTRVRNSIIVTNLSQCDMALIQYKNEYGEFPPDLLDETEVMRHCRKRWARWVYDKDQFLEALPVKEDSTNGYVPDGNPATAFLFWMRGPYKKKFDVPAVYVATPVPHWEAQSGGTLLLEHQTQNGWCSDPSNPMKISNTGRKFWEADYEFPVVYFRKDYDGKVFGNLGPYRDADGEYYVPEGYQLIHTGLDERYSDKPGSLTIGIDFLEEDADNMTNFSKGLVLSDFERKK